MTTQNKISSKFIEKGRSYYMISTPYGLCKMRASLYDLGAEVTIRAALNKQEYYISMAKIVHRKFLRLFFSQLCKQF